MIKYNLFLLGIGWYALGWLRLHLPGILHFLLGCSLVRERWSLYFRLNGFCLHIGNCNRCFNLWCLGCRSYRCCRFLLRLGNNGVSIRSKQVPGVSHFCLPGELGIPVLQFLENALGLFLCLEGFTHAEVAVLLGYDGEFILTIGYLA